MSRSATPELKPPELEPLDHRPLELGPRPLRRRLVSLTPLIDVVFLLLVFFMLASRFSIENELSLAAAGSGGGYQGPPRLIGVEAASVTLNGVSVELETLAARARALPPGPAAPIVLRVSDDVDAQRLVDVIDALAAAGLASIALTE